MQFTRKQIIKYIKSHQTASIPELSRVLNLTVGNIRHHIKELEGQEIIQESGNLPIKGKGRPIKFYALTKEAEDHNLDGLADILIKVLIGNKSRGDSEDCLKMIAKGMKGDFQSDMGSIQKLNQVVSWLDERHYQAHWEASPTGPRIIIDHCPYSAIQPKNPELCQMDAAILSELTGKSVRHISKRSNNYQEPKQCVFLVQEE